MRLKISFETEVPDDIGTEDEMMEWLRFMLNDNGSMAMSNPFSDLGDVDPILGTLDVETAR
tara:strand:- start:4280 stop:4462 length:183 start_codon:yes stop_codon:yes gene_type:complete